MPQQRHSRLPRAPEGRACLCTPLHEHDMITKRLNNEQVSLSVKPTVTADYRTEVREFKNLTEEIGWISNPHRDFSVF